MSLKPACLGLMLSWPAAALPAADFILYAPAQASLATLAVPAGVRAIGMGEAYTAAGDDVISLHYNPSGLARVTEFQLGLAHNELSSSLGLRQEYLSYGQRVGQASGVGVAFNYFSLGTLTGRTADGAQLSDSSPSAFGATAGYGWSVLADKRLKVGLAAEFAMESVFSGSQVGWGGSLGAAYDFAGNLSAGFSANHLGSGSGGFSPPSSVSAGLSGIFLGRRLLLDLDSTVPFHSDPLLKAGFELDLGFLQLRGGYRLALAAGPGDVQSGPSAGAGFRVGFFDIDYAYLPYGDVVSTHRIAATLELPADFFQPKTAGPEMSSETARVYFDQAVALEIDGKPIEAMVDYQMVENSYPEDMEENHPQEFYLAAQARMKAIKADLEKKGGDSVETRAFIALHERKAREFLEAGRGQEALAEVRQVESFDKSSAMILQLRKQVELSISSRLVGLRAEARSADKYGDLASAVDKYIRIQGVDPNDGEASAFFSRRHAEIRYLLTSIHRKGIDLYVDGKVDEALSVWKKGKAIDIDKGQTVDFDRDIKKAKTQIEQRGQK